MAKKVPGPRGWPLTGSLYAISYDLLGFLERSRARYGDLLRLRVAWVPVYVASSPEDARHVLLEHRDNYEKTSRSSVEIRHIAGTSLLTANGADWTEKRRLLQPAFKVGAVGAYHEVMNTATEEMLARWRRDFPDGGVLDMAQEMMRLTYRIVSEALLGEDLRHTAGIVDAALEIMLQRVVTRLKRPSLPIAWPTPANLKFQRERRRLHELIDGIIARRRAQQREPRDLLDAMIQATDNQTATLDPLWLRDEVMTLLLAGHETTANALNWTWHLLSQHADIQERAFAAADGDENPLAIPYLRQVLFESMRLYPPIWLVERQARAADTLGGYDIPAGATVAVAIWLLHRHPDHWPEPERFDPERFRDSPAQGRPGHHYLPFGLGPRMCLGMNFAVNEAMIILARCLTHIRVQPLDGAQPVVPLAGVTLRPRDGLPLRFHWRD